MALLENEHNVLSATSGPEAIALVQTRPVNVVLMDVQMPDMDGFETAKRIKQLDAGRDITIIFVTAVYNEDPFVRKGYQSGGIDYFSKPFDPEVLRMKVGIYASHALRIDLLRERERHVQESEELIRVGRKLSTLLESLPVGVMIADPDGRICQATDEVSRIIKVTEPVASDAYGEILGWWDKAGRSIKNSDGPLARALHHGELTHSEPIDIRCFDGSTKKVLVSASPLRGLDGRQVGAVVLLRDVTEARTIEQAMEERVTKLISLGVELEESAAR